MSAGVDGMTTVSPGMCASRASRLCECWLPEERPAPNCVRTVSAICAAPPVMKGSLAAWLSSWSRHTPTKSRYISSTTGRIPAMAAPTPRPMIAVSEIGVSRTRSPNRSCSPRMSPNTLPPAATSMPATKTLVVAVELDLEGVVDRVHRAEDRRVVGHGRRLGAIRPRSHDELVQRLGGRAGELARLVHRPVELVGHRGLEGTDRRRRRSRPIGDGPRARCSGSRSCHASSSSGDR